MRISAEELRAYGACFDNRSLKKVFKGKSRLINKNLLLKVRDNLISCGEKVCDTCFNMNLRWFLDSCLSDEDANSDENRKVRRQISRKGSMKAIKIFLNYINGE